MNIIKSICIIIMLLLGVVNGLWESKNNGIYYNKELFELKGINHFGFETNVMAPHGYNVHDIDWYLDFIYTNKFNAIRIPFSYEMVMNINNPFPNSYMLSQISDKECTTNPGSLLDCIFKKASDRGIVILIDFHTIDYTIQEKPYGRLSKDEFYYTWDTIIDRVIKYPNLLGIDVQNECHGSTTWDEYSVFINDFVSHINNKYPTFPGLIFVEGIQDVYDAAWGGSFALIDNKINYDKKIVFSPHVYGPSVRGSYANSDNAENFERWFGFLSNKYDNAIIIGEYGGTYTLNPDDYAWHNRLIEYLINTNKRNTFYWCLNPNSGDTKGVLNDDWTTPNNDKLILLDKLQPNSTVIKFNYKKNLRKN